MCSCNPEKVNYPQNYEWGPRIWNVLHGLSLRAATASMEMMKADEMRAWEKVLVTTGPMLPCEDCRDHYSQWLLDNPIKPFTSLPYFEKGEWIRLWLYNLHSNVNRRLGKQNMYISELRDTYSRINVGDELKSLDGLITRALKVGGGTSLLKYKEWLKHVGMLRSIYY